MGINIPNKMYHVYLLIDPKSGVFYVGVGKIKRLNSTIHDKNNYDKYARIQDIKSRGDKVLQEIVFSSNDRFECLKIEHKLIEEYKDCLLNKSGITCAYPESMYNHVVVECHPLRTTR